MFHHGAPLLTSFDTVHLGVISATSEFPVPTSSSLRVRHRWCSHAIRGWWLPDRHWHQRCRLVDLHTATEEGWGMAADGGPRWLVCRLLAGSDLFKLIWSGLVWLVLFYSVLFCCCASLLVLVLVGCWLFINFLLLLRSCGSCCNLYQGLTCIRVKWFSVNILSAFGCSGRPWYRRFEALPRTRLLRGRVFGGVYGPNEKMNTLGALALMGHRSFKKTATALQHNYGGVQQLGHFSSLSSIGIDILARMAFNFGVRSSKRKNEKCFFFSMSGFYRAQRKPAGSLWQPQYQQTVRTLLLGTAILGSGAHVCARLSANPGNPEDCLLRSC